MNDSELLKNYKKAINDFSADSESFRRGFEFRISDKFSFRIRQTNCGNECFINVCADRCKDDGPEYPLIHKTQAFQKEWISNQDIINHDDTMSRYYERFKNYPKLLKNNPEEAKKFSENIRIMNAFNEAKPLLPSQEQRFNYIYRIVRELFTEESIPCLDNKRCFGLLVIWNLYTNEYKIFIIGLPEYTFIPKIMCKVFRTGNCKFKEDLCKEIQKVMITNRKKVYQIIEDFIKINS